MLKYLPAYLNHLLFQLSYSIRCLSVILVLDVIKFYFSILKKNLDFGRSFEFTRMCRFNSCLWSFLKMFLTSVLNSVIAWQNDQGIEKLLARSLPHSQTYRKVLNFSIVFFKFFFKAYPKILEVLHLCSVNTPGLFERVCVYVVFLCIPVRPEEHSALNDNEVRCHSWYSTCANPQPQFHNMCACILFFPKLWNMKPNLSLNSKTMLFL